MRAILVLNAGSSSLKFQIFAVAGDGLERRVRGQIDGIGVRPRLRASDGEGALLVDREPAREEMPDLPAATGEILGLGAGIDGVEVCAIGHRVVHGGAAFDRPVAVDAGVMARLAALEPLAPLHQPHNLAAIRLAGEAYPGVPQVACFDTAFHRGRPEYAEGYALPRAFYDEGIRRYGFHGLSYEYVAGRLREIAPALAAGRVIVAHLGNGASMCAMAGGRSVETTMGFTALDGLPMGTRPGQLDPGVVLLLFEGSGMRAERGGGAPLPQVGAARALGGIERHARPARQRRGGGGVRGRAFRLSGGVLAGELAAALGGSGRRRLHRRDRRERRPIRVGIAERLGWLGAVLDPVANAAGAVVISTPGSRVALLVVPTDEELTIARHTRGVVGI